MHTKAQQEVRQDERSGQTQNRIKDYVQGTLPQLEQEAAVVTLKIQEANFPLSTCIRVST